MKSKEKLKRFIRESKKSEYGGVWFSPIGPLAISKKGEVARYGRPLPRKEEKQDGK